MHEDDFAAAGIHADRMLAEMQRTIVAFARQSCFDVSVLRDACQPGSVLHVAVRAYVGHLKASGLSPEKLLVVVKRAVAQFENVPYQLGGRPLVEGVISASI